MVYTIDTPRERMVRDQQKLLIHCLFLGFLIIWVPPTLSVPSVSQRQMLCSQTSTPKTAVHSSCLVLFSFSISLLLLALIERVTKFLCKQNCQLPPSLPFPVDYSLRLKFLSSIWFQAFCHSSLAFLLFQQLPGSCAISALFAKSLLGSQPLPLL